MVRRFSGIGAGPFALSGAEARLDGGATIAPPDWLRDTEALGVAIAGDGPTVLYGRGGPEMTDCPRAGCARFIVASDAPAGLRNGMGL